MKPDRRFGTERERSVARSDESVAAETETGLGEYTSELFLCYFGIKMFRRYAACEKLVQYLLRLSD